MEGQTQRTIHDKRPYPGVPVTKMGPEPERRGVGLNGKQKDILNQKNALSRHQAKAKLITNPKVRHNKPEK